MVPGDLRGSLSDWESVVNLRVAAYWLAGLWFITRDGAVSYSVATSRKEGCVIYCGMMVSSIYFCASSLLSFDVIKSHLPVLVNWFDSSRPENNWCFAAWLRIW